MNDAITPKIAIKAVVGQHLTDDEAFRIYSHARLEMGAGVNPMPDEIADAARELGLMDPYENVKIDDETFAGYLAAGYDEQTALGIIAANEEGEDEPPDHDPTRIVEDREGEVRESDLT